MSHQGGGFRVAPVRTERSGFAADGTMALAGFGLDVIAPPYSNLRLKIVVVVVDPCENRGWDSTHSFSRIPLAPGRRSSLLCIRVPDSGSRQDSKAGESGE